MIYVCVPVHNEAKTAGLVLWKVRQVFTRFEREYHLLVCDDASSDATAEVLASYARVLPMTVVTHRERRGYAGSLEELLRLALQRTDRPKRDCAITLHADFVHAPETMEEMVKRLESGTDLVVAELSRQGETSRAMRWARRLAPRLLRVAGVKDPLSGFLALRLIVLRQALRPPVEQALLTTQGWCANAELLARLAPHARRLDTIAATARYDLRQRPSRVKPWDALLQVWRARAVIRAARAVAVALALIAAPAALGAQTDTTGRPPAAAAVSAIAVVSPQPVLFPVGERLRYQAKFGIFNVGQATMEVAGVDTLRGVETVRFRFHIVGGALWYHLDQLMESWVGRHDFRSRRFRQETEEKGKQRLREYDIFPDSGFYRETGRDTTFATIADPLDDAAFLYWIRTVPLEVGKRYEYNRYFRPDRNPVIIEVLGHERVNVAGRRYNAIVVRPIIPKGRGIFAEKSDARIWLSDDPQRLMLAMVSTFSFGTVTLKLREYVAAAPPPEQP
jgi:glycosyltransferase involved in cell wall biosynthesis